MREQFVCVRITQMNGVNLRRFDFDYDVTWNGFFLDEDLNVYSRYGGRDDGEPEDRLSKASLLAGSLTGMHQLGFALAFGVMLDTFVVRPILVPAYLILLHSGRFRSLTRLLGAEEPPRPAPPIPEPHIDMPVTSDTRV